MAELKWADADLQWQRPSVGAGMKWANAAGTASWSDGMLKYWDGLNWQALTYDRWAQKTDMGFTRPLGAVAYGATIYVPTETHMQSYNTLTDTWTTLTAPPVALDIDGVVAIVADKVYVFNRTGAGAKQLNIYTITTDVWSTGTAYPGAGVREPWCGAIDGKIYVGGGNDGSGNIQSDHWEYDPAGNSWQQRATAGQPRWLAASGVIAGKLYVAGGRKVNTSSNQIAAIQVYDPAADRWDGGASMFESVEDSQHAVIGSKFYLCGGYNSTFTRQKSVHVYDASRDEWNMRAVMPDTIASGAAAAVNGRIYVCGGFSGIDTVAVYEYGA